MTVQALIDALNKSEPPLPTSSAYRPSRNGESAVRYLKLGNFSNLAFNTTMNNKTPLLH